MPREKEEIHEHPDGWVYVRTKKGEYFDTRENFELDSGMTLPALPAGADEHIYTKNVRHCYMGDGNIIAGGERNDQELNAIIDSIDALLKKKKDREDKVKAENELKQQKEMAAPPKR